MEGQDVVTLATARDITDSSVEQGLEAELSVDLERKNPAGNGKEQPQKIDASRHANRGIRNPHGARKSDGLEGAGIASSDAIVVSPAAASAAVVGRVVRHSVR
jgi:hypothetical protein